MTSTIEKESIPVPAFTCLGAVWEGDCPELLRRALASLNRNTLLPKEIILVQDGPLSPALHQILESYSDLVPIRTLALPFNRGLGGALNAGMGLVKTEYVVRFDADDESVAGRFALIMGALASGVDLVGGQLHEVNSPDFPATYRKVPLDQAAITRMLPWRCPFNHNTVGFRAAMVRDVGGYPNIRFREDYALWARVLAAGHPVINLPDTVVEASAGNALLRRRGGLRILRAEFELRRFLVDQGISSLSRSWCAFICRAFVMSLPLMIRRFIYRRLLR